MELNLRTVLVILGSLFMLGILVDGFRRMRRARQEALKIDVQGNFKFPDEGFSSELPNGGARVIEESTQSELLEEAYAFKDQLDDLPGLSALDEIDTNAGDKKEETYAEEKAEEMSVEDFDISSESYTDVDSSAYHSEKVDAPLKDQFTVELSENSATKITDELQEGLKEESTLQADKDSNRDAWVSKTTPLNLDEHVPLLMDVEELGEELSPHSVVANSLTDTVKQEESQPPVSLFDTEVSVEKNNAIDDDQELYIESVIEPAIESPIEPTIEPAIIESEPMVDDEIANDGRQYVEDMTTQAAYAPVKKPGPNAEILANREAASLVLITHVVPHDEDGFCGEDILYLVNNCDLRHGEKGIFHRFENPNGEGYIQFSMANSFNPGTFDPETLLHERIYGVSLFMSLPGPEKAMDAFEAMSEMASVIARNLGGDVHDETHSIMALQTIEHNRQQVRDFVRKQKIAGKK